MAKDPAFLFYTSDFMTGISDLTMEERGQYITILCLQHQKGHLPEKTIRLAVGLASVDVLKKFKQDENGNFFNERLETEIQKRIEFTTSRRLNGLKGGRPKKEEKPNGYPNGLPLGYPNGKATDNLPENEYILNSNIDFNTLRNYYNSTLIKFLIHVFEEKKAESIEEIKSFEMIVLEMNKVWAKHKPNYTFLNEADYPALLQIAYLIAQVKKFNKHSVVKDPFVADEVTQSFDKIAEFLVKTSDKYLFKLTLKQIAHPNNFQTIFEAMKELRPIEKAKELEKKRIQPEDYFTK